MKSEDGVVKNLMLVIAFPVPFVFKPTEYESPSVLFVTPVPPLLISFLVPVIYVSSSHFSAAYFLAAIASSVSAPAASSSSLKSS